MEFGDYFAAQGQALMRLAYVMTGDRQSAEDVTQETLLQVYRRWSGLRDPHAYARRSVVNGAISLGRRRTRFSGCEAPDVSIGDPSTSVLLRVELWSAVCQLPERQRAVVVLRYYEDLSDREVGRVLGIRESTVRSTAVRALASLRGARLTDNEGAGTR